MRLRISLYKRVCPSVRRSVGPWSVRPSRVFFKSRKSRGNDIESLENKIWQINLTNLTNLSDKSILVLNFRRNFVRTNLFSFSLSLYYLLFFQRFTVRHPLQSDAKGVHWTPQTPLPVRPCISYMAIWPFKVDVSYPNELKSQFAHRVHDLPNSHVIAKGTVSSMEPSHSKISYAMPLSCQPTLSVSSQTITPIWDQGGPPHSPKTGRNATQTTAFFFVDALSG